MQREFRYFPLKDIELRTSDDGKRTMSGYAAVFNSLSENLGNFREKIAPGAFTRSINGKADVVALSEHDPKKGILGRTTSGTLRLSQDSVGLRFECDLPSTTLGNDISESLSRRDLNAMSFGFVTKDQDWDYDNGETIRTLKDVDLFDVSVVANPAYPATSVSMRSLMFPDGEIVRAMDDQSDTLQDADATGLDCDCQCERCMENRCEECSMEPCTAEQCRCGDYRTDQLLAKCLELRLTHK